MTSAAFSSPHGTPTQRNRRLLLTLPAAVALPSFITACGGGADLNYTTEQALYFVGEPITPNTLPEPAPGSRPPGHTAPTFSVWPPLPAGLKLDAKTGTISGTPTKLQRQASYTVVANNNKGFAETCVRITVTGRGKWVPAAPLAMARVAASISPLPGGKLLVAGGITDEGMTDLTEIYDPSTAVWSSAATMLYPRSIHVAVALRGGRVLIVQGSGSPDLSIPELYDPVANAWTATGRMNEVRKLCTSHLLPNGKVLAVGGTNDRDVHDSAEVYDPLTGAWTLLPTRLSVARVLHAAVLLSDGKTLLVIGGNGDGDSAATAELYKVDGSSTKVIPYGFNGRYHYAVKLDDGSVLVIVESGNLSRRFNPATSTWTTSTMLSGERNNPTVTLLADGRVLVACGTESNDAEIYNPDVNRWTAAAPTVNARQRTVAALLGDGSVLVVGGSSSDGFLDASERYIP